MALNTTLRGGSAAKTSDPTRYGCFPVVIGALLEHRLSKRITLPSGRTLGIGQKLHAEVQDITRHPKAQAHAQWLCRSPHCTGKTWSTKEELLADHPDNRALKAQQEVHAFYAVAYVPPQPEIPPVKDKAGNITVEAVPAEPEKLLLLSDEE